MCKQYQRDLDDPWYDELDPVLKVYMYEHWCRDKEEEFELARSQSILIGSFTNPSAAQDMLKQENPDFASSDEDFARSLEMVKESKKNDKKKRKRQRKIISSQKA